jgi:hypothetical protein
MTEPDDLEPRRRVRADAEQELARVAEIKALRAELDELLAELPAMPFGDDARFFETMDRVHAVLRRPPPSVRLTNWP